MPIGKKCVNCVYNLKIWKNLRQTLRYKKSTSWFPISTLTRVNNTTKKNKDRQKYFRAKNYTHKLPCIYMRWCKQIFKQSLQEIVYNRLLETSCGLEIGQPHLMWPRLMQWAGRGELSAVARSSDNCLPPVLPAWPKVITASSKQLTF
jgi:hypothetical protein